MKTRFQQTDVVTPAEAKRNLIDLTEMMFRLRRAPDNACHEASAAALDILRDLVKKNPRYCEAAAELWLDDLTRA